MKHTLTTKRSTPYGVETMTVGWNHDPTPEEYDAANIRKYTGLPLEPGQGIRARKIGRVLFILNTGPPTWWFPRLKFDLKHSGIRGGWLRAAFEIGYMKRKTQ